jgi:hypothetical protein
MTARRSFRGERWPLSRAVGIQFRILPPREVPRLPRTTSASPSHLMSLDRMVPSLMSLDVISAEAPAAGAATANAMTLQIKTLRRIRKNHRLRPAQD